MSERHQNPREANVSITSVEAFHAIAAVLQGLSTKDKITTLGNAMAIEIASAAPSLERALEVVEGVLRDSKRAIEIMLIRLTHTNAEAY